MNEYCGLGNKRGTRKSKQLWGIEMNSAHNIYLQNYCHIDCMDHMIKNARLFYRLWKYWHLPMIHGKAVAVVVVYDMYLEVSEGKNNNDWKLDELMNFWRLREVGKLGASIQAECTEIPR